MPNRGQELPCLVLWALKIDKRHLGTRGGDGHSCCLRCPRRSPSLESKDLGSGRHGRESRGTWTAWDAKNGGYFSLSTRLALELLWQQTAGMPVRVFPERFNFGGKTNPECGQHHPMGPGLQKKVSGSPVSLSLSVSPSCGCNVTTLAQPSF